MTPNQRRQILYFLGYDGPADHISDEQLRAEYLEARAYGQTQPYPTHKNDEDLFE